MMASCGCMPKALSASWYGSGCGFGRADSSPSTMMSNHSLRDEGICSHAGIAHTASHVPTYWSGDTKGFWVHPEKHIHNK